MTPRKAGPSKTSKTPAKTTAKAGARRAPAGSKSAASGSRRAAKVARPAAGERLRVELTKDGDPYGVTILINQAARIADRLEALDRLLSGQDWLLAGGEAPRVVEVTPRTVAVIVEVRVDKPLLEERNLTTVLRHLMADIHRHRAGIPGDPGDDEDVMDGI